MFLDSAAALLICTNTRQIFVRFQKHFYVLVLLFCLGYYFYLRISMCKVKSLMMDTAIQSLKQQMSQQLKLGFPS